MLRSWSIHKSSITFYLCFFFISFFIWFSFRFVSNSLSAPDQYVFSPSIIYLEFYMKHYEKRTVLNQRIQALFSKLFRICEYYTGHTFRQFQIYRHFTINVALNGSNWLRYDPNDKTRLTPCSSKQQPTMMMIMKRKRAPVCLLLFRYVSNHFAVDHSTPHRF